MLKVLCVCSATARAQLLRYCASSSSAVFVLGGPADPDPDQDPVAIAHAMAGIAGDVMRLCYSSRLLEEQAPVTLQDMCNIVRDFKHISKLVADNMLSALDLEDR